MVHASWHEMDFRFIELTHYLRTVCLSLHLAALAQRTSGVEHLSQTSLQLHPITTQMASTKRKREMATLSQLLGDPSVSIASLQKVLKQLRDESVMGGRRQIMTSVQDRLKHVKHTEHLVDMRGLPIEWVFCDPGKLLMYLIEACPKLAEIYAYAANQHRNAEWRVIVEFDEFIPGNKLRLENRRKSMSLCFSFVELGRRFLRIPCTWMFPVVCRCGLYHSVEGGWSNFFRIFLRRMFLSPNALNTSGVPLLLRGEEYLLTAKLEHVLSDGQGLQIALNWKGASSLRACWDHWNVIKKGSAVVGQSPELVDITCSCMEAFQEQTDEDTTENIEVIEAAANRFAAGQITKTMFENICTSRGINYNRYGVLFDPATRQMIKQRTVKKDWVHTCLCDGIVSCEIHLILVAAQEKVGKGFESVALFLKGGWELPRGRGVTLKSLLAIFDDIRHEYSETHEKIKASASELLSVYGLLRHWVLVELRGEDGMADHVESFNAVCEVVDILLRAKDGGLSTVEASRLLKRAAPRHFSLHKACYGTDHIKPKHHWIFDIILKLPDCEVVLDAFLIEKEHLLARECANPVKNTTKFEESVLSRMLHAQVKSLNDLGPQSELMGARVPYPGFADAFVSDTLTLNGVTYSVGDFVFLNTLPGKVLACIQEGADFYFVVDLFQLARRLSNESGHYACKGRRGVWNARDVSLALAWRQTGDRIYTILFC